MKNSKKGSARLNTVSILIGSLVVAIAVSIQARDGQDRGSRNNRPIVVTDKGPVRGFVRHGVNIFLGIPYAAPPVGNLRWMPPRQARPWVGVLDATEYANTCPQIDELGVFAGPSSASEDCLYLNVFTTGLGKGTRALKPVLVWLHGGGNFAGESNDYDGSKLATGGRFGVPTAVVTINYRLGLLGFLSESHLNSEGHLSGNYGILDQQAALRWVQANIAAFGGDPNRVALGGQSAGAQDTMANMISPLATGLFNRAIIQSHPAVVFFTAANALSNGNAFAAASGCLDAACLRGLSVERILQLQDPYITWPFADGTIIPIPSDVGWATGEYNHMAIMGGATKDEGLFGAGRREYRSGPPQVVLTPAQYTTDNPASVLAEYPLSNYDGDPTVAQERINTDPAKCRVLQILKSQAATDGGFKVYGYDFTYENSPFYFPQMPNLYSPTGHFRPLADHSSDIQYLFKGWHGGNLGVNVDQTTGQARELEGAEIALSDQLVAAWTHFAATGNPNGSGTPIWPAFTPHSAVFLREDIPNSIETEAQYRANYKCDFWDGMPTGK